MNQMSIPKPTNSLEKLHEKKKQPNLQIAIMKAIAMNGSLTKPKLAKILDSKSTSIATTITKDSDAPEPLRIFRKLKEFELFKEVIQQPLFQLTDFGMTMLLVSHYKETDKENNPIPLLNRKEFSKLISIFKQKHGNNFSDFKKDKILEVVTYYYLNANTKIYDKIVSEMKNNSELQDLKTKINLNISEITNLENQNKNHKEKIIGLLSKEFISD